MNIFDCMAYKNIGVKISSENGVISLNISDGDNSLFISFGLSQAKLIAEGIIKALEIIPVPDVKESMYFGDAAITYGEINKAANNETEEKTDEKELETETKSVEAEPLTGTAA